MGAGASSPSVQVLTETGTLGFLAVLGRAVVYLRAFRKPPGPGAGPDAIRRAGGAARHCRHPGTQFGGFQSADPGQRRNVLCGRGNRRRCFLPDEPPVQIVAALGRLASRTISRKKLDAPKS